MGTLAIIGNVIGAGGSAKSYLPTDDPATLEMWYDAEYAALTYAENDDVTQWDDRSGNARHLTVMATKNAPKMRSTGGANSKPALEFLQAGDRVLQTASFTSIPQPQHIFIVMRIDFWTNVRYVLDWNVAAQGHFYLVTATPQVRVHAGSTGPAITDTVLGQDHIIELFNSGTSSTAIVDDNAAITGTVGTLGMDVMTVGATAAGLNPAEFTISELIVRSAEATGDVLTNTRSYLNTKYGIATN